MYLLTPDVEYCATLYTCLQLIKPSQTFSHIHGSSGVTDVHCRGDTVLSCGRDGRYCQFTVVDGNRLQLVSANKVAHLWTVSSITDFKNKLKYHLFKPAFDIL